MAPLNEARLLVLGDEAVGKTSLVRFLTSGEPRDPNEQKTPGAAITDTIETQAWRVGGSNIQLNIWDFGGQEILHGTHRFFLSERSLYLVVLEARREDDDSVFAWLRTVRSRGGDSPVIIVINKCDEGYHNLDLDETNLRRDYPNIVDIVPASCEDNEFARQSIAGLRHTIATTLEEDQRLSHVRDPIPAPWREVKNRVADLAGEQFLLEFQAFVELCLSPGGQDSISDADEQLALLRLLNDLGVVVAHGLHRTSPAALREVTLLDPNWLTGAVYSLLNARSVLEQGGEFNRAELSSLLDPARYPARWHEYILDMMQSPDLGLCFQLTSRPEDERYLLPEALPASEPDYGIWPADSLRFRYEYAFLPRGLVPRFIVHANRHLTARPTRWRTGVVLSVDDCPVLVKGDRERRRIDILVSGPVAKRRSALAIVRDLLATVHRIHPEADPTPRVPLPDRLDQSVPYEHLLRMEEREGPEHGFYPEAGGGRSYRVGDLLEGLRADRKATRESDQSGETLDESLRLGRLLLVAFVIASVVITAIAVTAGAEWAVIVGAALGVVVVLGMFVLRWSHRISEKGFIEIIKAVLRK